MSSKDHRKIEKKIFKTYMSSPLRLNSKGITIKLRNSFLTDITSLIGIGYNPIVGNVSTMDEIWSSLFSGSRSLRNVIRNLKIRYMDEQTRNQKIKNSDKKGFLPGLDRYDNQIGGGPSSI